jgi:hypothetical protein
VRRSPTTFPTAPRPAPSRLSEATERRLGTHDHQHELPDQPQQESAPSPPSATCCRAPGCQGRHADTGGGQPRGGERTAVERNASTLLDRRFPVRRCWDPARCPTQRSACMGCSNRSRRDPRCRRAAFDSKHYVAAGRFVCLPCTHNRPRCCSDRVDRRRRRGCPAGVRSSPARRKCSRSARPHRVRETQRSVAPKPGGQDRSKPRDRAFSAYSIKTAAVPAAPE